MEFDAVLNRAIGCALEVQPNEVRSAVVPLRASCSSWCKWCKKHYDHPNAGFTYTLEKQKNFSIFSIDYTL